MQHYLYGFYDGTASMFTMWYLLNLIQYHFFTFKGLKRLCLHLQPHTNKPLLLQCDHIFWSSLVYNKTGNEFFGYGRPQMSEWLICLGWLNTNIVKSL